MSQKLLLSKSIVFEGANFIDYIHQSVIDLESNIPKDEINNLIIKSLTYIDKNLDNQTIDELISLIISCFIHLPDPSDEIIKNIIENSQKNSNRIIITASILSSLSKKTAVFKDPRVDSFLTDSLVQITKHIQKPSQEFTIFGHEIQPQYEANFIIDMLLVIKYSEKSLKLFIPYIFSQKRISKTKFQKFIEKISRMNLLTAISDSILLDREFFPLFTMDNLHKFIIKMNDETFFKLCPLIEENYSKVKKWSRHFATAILYKCVKLKIKDFKLIDNLLHSLDASHMINAIWKYLDQLNVILPISLADQIQNFPNPDAALKIMPNLDTIPVDVLSQSLLKSNDFDVYYRVFESNVLLNHPVENVFDKQEFWIHFLSVVSSSEKECSFEFLNFLVNMFTNYNDKEKFNDIFIQMILDKFPNTKNGNLFLISFYKKFYFDYKSVYIENNLNLIFEIMARGILPYPIFWELIQFNRIRNYFLENITNPLLLYAYEFSLMRKLESKDLINNIIIEKVSNFDLINEFILKNDLDFLVKMNDESLTFIIYSFIFTRNKQKPKVEGLTKETILPFFALGFNYVKYCKRNLLFSSKEISGLLIEACIFLSNSKSQILITSINTILSKFEDLMDPSVFPTKTAIEMIRTLYKLLVSNSYPADKSLFLSVLFKLSRRNKSIPEITELLENNSMSLFNYMIDNMEKIPDFNKLNNYPLNLDSFDCSNFIKEFFNVIQNEKEKIIRAITLIEKYCKSVQKIRISNVDKIIEVFQQSIKEKKFDDVLSLGMFLKNNNFDKIIQRYVNEPIPYRIKEKLFDSIPFDLGLIDEIISDILSTSQPENDLTNCEFLFNELMKNENIVVYYLTIMFEKIDYKQEMKPNLFLKHFSNEYKLYKDLFIDAIRCVFGYHQIKNVFVRKMSIKLPVIDTINPIITKLLNHQKHQSFYCLINIASSFPFLLEKNPQLVFDSVIPCLDHFSLYFTIQKDCKSDEIINKLKDSVSALFFLHSCLYSVQILDSFIPWLFTNILNFSESQILSLTFILSSLFKTKKVQELLLFLSMKYDFIETVNKLFDKDLKMKEIKGLFSNNLFSILISYYDLLRNLRSKADIVYNDEIKNQKNPFVKFFDNKSTILPLELKKLEIPPCKNDEIVDFMNKICEIKHFWLTSILQNNAVLNQNIDNFVNHYKSIESNLPDVSSIPQIPRISSTYYEIVRLISNQPNWVFRWISNREYFELLPEHANKILEVKNEIDSYQHDNFLCSDIDLDDYFISQYCQEKLFNKLLNDILSYENHQQFLSVCKLIEILSDNKVALLSILDLLNRYLYDKKTQFNSSEPVNKLLNVLNNTVKFRNNFMQICGKNLIELILTPDYRSDPQILLKSGKYFTSIDSKLPVQITHLIGFMFIHNSEELISLALDLCSKTSEITNLNYIIEEYFERELKKKNPSYDIINGFVQIPTIIENKIKKLPEVFEIIVKKYSDGTSNDSGTQDLICTLLNILASEKIKDQFKFEPDSIDLGKSYDSIDDSPHSSIQDPYSLKSAPKELIKKNPDFWNLYDSYLVTINEIVSNNESKMSKLKFVFDYPNLISFKGRLKFFREKMDKRINKNSYFYINVDRSNILVSSFTNLKNKPASDWLKILKVSFNGERGADAGGLTREWFTYVIRELFNANNALFVSSESKSYQPNKSSYINQEHLEYFEFAGKIIARALIQGQCVNAHLTRSFIRQILGQQIKFIDLQDLDKELYKNLEDLEEMDVEPLDLVFSIDAYEYGVHKTIDLKENGEEIPVTNDNKIEYISLYADYHLRKAIIDQIDAFRKGFNSLIQQEDVRLFSPSEFDLLICGIPEIDIEDLKRNTTYCHPYSNDHPVIIMFFKVISKWDNENLAKFLLFLTGSSQVPVNGFKYYKDCDKPIKISPGGSRERLCVAHTCFNILDLPCYENEDEMNDKLIQSIQECEFGLV